MLRIIKSLMVIAIVATVAVGATGAYFTDQETISGMTFATGTLSIEDTSDTWMQHHIDFQNLKPGDTIRKWVKISNDGTLDVDSLKIGVANVTGDATLLNQMTVAVYGTVTGYNQGIYSPSWGTGQPIVPWLNGIDVLGTPVYVNPGNTAADKMVPGSTDTIILDFRLPATSGNEWSGMSASFDLTFDAEQSHTGASYF